MFLEPLISSFDKFEKKFSQNSWMQNELHLLKKIRAYILQESQNFPPKCTYSYMYFEEIITEILNQTGTEPSYDKRAFDIVFSTKVFTSKDSYSLIFNWLQRKIQNETSNFTKKLDALFEENKYPNLWNYLNYSPKYWQKNNQLSSAGLYILSNLSGKSLNNNLQILQLLLDFDPISLTNPQSFTKELTEKFPKISLLDKYVPEIIKSINANFSLEGAEMLLSFDTIRFEPYLKECLTKLQDKNRFQLFMLLYQFSPEKYAPKVLEISYKYIHEQLNKMRNNVNYYPDYQWNAKLQIGNYSLVKALRSIGETEPDNTKKIAVFKEILTECWRLPTQVLPLLIDFFPDEAPSLLLNVIKNFSQEKSQSYLAKEIIREGFKQLSKSFSSPTNSQLFVEKKLESVEESIWELLQSKSKEIRELASLTLAKFGDRITPRAAQFLNHKKADIRMTGVFLLSLLKNKDAIEILKNTLDNETNDDTRDLILEALQGKIDFPITKKAVLEMIDFARKRKKIEKPLESWLDEVNLPPLFWIDGEKLTAEEIRFLIYRQSRKKEMVSDVEARALLLFLDKEKAGNFAQTILKLYLENSADAKQKYILSLAGLLGNETIVNKLKTQTVEWADNMRGKMAEHTVKAIALQGSTKALRTVEWISRKYKNKVKNVGQAALQAFEIAANELGITAFELADRIIPNFDFEGLFKNFDINGEPYRAYINPQFKLVFLDEDNKMLKSLPKGASKELQEEFKAITKEVRDIVKSQSSRLDYYLVTQRRWQSNNWTDFFLQNPIMFSYAIRLIWGIYDEKGLLLQTFAVQEDQTLLNDKWEEVDLSQFHGHFIGMVHPLSLTQEQKEYWLHYLYDNSIESIFPQLNRAEYLLPDEQKKDVFIKEFSGITLSGYAFVGFMDKKGWHRGSIQDGGWISSYYKDFSEAGLWVFLEQKGNLSVGYLEADGQVGEVYFVQKGSVIIGNYTYDNPENDKDNRLIKLGDVPPIIYSEVMADLTQIKEISENGKE